MNFQIWVSDIFAKQEQFLVNSIILMYANPYNQILQIVNETSQLESSVSAFDEKISFKVLIG